MRGQAFAIDVLSSRHVLSASQELLVRSRHRLAQSRAQLHAAQVNITARGRIGGGSDAVAEWRPACGHANAVALKVRGTYDDACRERQRLRDHFPGCHVSPVMPIGTFEWSWTLCGECAP